MLVRKIKFTDYNGTEQEKEYMFNLNKAEIIEWLTTEGDYTLDKLLEKLGKEKNGKQVIKIFKDLIYISYGEVSLDGSRFVKSKEVKDKFMESEAYSELFVELVTDAKKAAAFINGIIPSDIASEIDVIMKNNPDGIPDEVRDYLLESENVTPINQA